jgi:ribosome biogenesis GTPase
MDALARLGFSAHFRDAVRANALHDGAPARVARIERRQVLALGLDRPAEGLDGEPRWVPVRSSLRFESERDVPKLAVGDWVWVRAGRHPAVERVLPRATCLVRKRAHRRSEPQPIAANVDVVFVVTTGGRDLNLARLERYVTAVRDAGARPVVVVNKVDETHDADAISATVSDLPAVDALRVSAATGFGLEALFARVSVGATAAFVGSSGVGKSTLINAFLGGAAQATGRVRDRDQKGRHTTTSRQLFASARGALLIDNPGVREFGLWDADDGLDETFADIEALIEACRFSDCSHETEPGCAVREAIDAHALDPERLDRYLSLQREVFREQTRAEAKDAKARWKRIHQNVRARRAFSRKHGLKD